MLRLGGFRFLPLVEMTGSLFMKPAQAGRGLEPLFQPFERAESACATFLEAMDRQKDIFAYSLQATLKCWKRTR